LTKKLVRPCSSKKVHIYELETHWQAGKSFPSAFMAQEEKIRTAELINRSAFTGNEVADALNRNSERIARGLLEGSSMGKKR
jgi:hypothetical protein